MSKRAQGMTNKNNEGRATSGVEMIDTPIKFRSLTSNEIECREQSKSKDNKTIYLLLYKDARVDMNLLDETVGAERWDCDYKEVKGNVYCRVGILSNRGEWVWKWDCGTESSTEREKGEASDAFKRACFKWGLGRELYTAPKIAVQLNEKDYFNGKLCQSFSVKEIEVSSKKVITYLLIVDKFGKERFEWGKKKSKLTEKQKEAVLARLAKGEDLWNNLRDAFIFDELALRKELEELLKEKAE